MRPFELRTDLQRSMIDGFAMPLGIVPAGIEAPIQGYTISYNAGEEEDPDSYAFHVVVSHERLQPILDRCFALLPDHVLPILEIGSRDAYRAVDVYVGAEPIPRAEFLDVWNMFAPILMEDGTLAAGANFDDPFIEVFVDQWKGISIHVAPSQRDEIEQMLGEFGLVEVPETWSPFEPEAGLAETEFRSVLAVEDEYSPDPDELLLTLRHAWGLELNIDPEINLDESGRDLGLTLWHAVILVEDARNEERGAYASIWATASSMQELMEMIRHVLDEQRGWRFGEVYTVDRVAFDERPDRLNGIAPRRTKPEVHLVEYEEWTAQAGEEST